MRINALGRLLCALVVLVLLASCSRLVHPEGALIAAEPEFTLRLRSVEGRRRVDGHGGRAVLPAGRYWIEGWSARRRDGRGRRWEVRRAEGEPARVVEVVRGGETPLPLAEPVQPELVIEQSSQEVSFRLRLKGSGNETLGEVRVNGRRVPPPALRIEDGHGRTIARLPGDESCGAGCARTWRPPHALVQPLRAIPEANLGPFRLAAILFRFRLQNASAHPPHAGPRA